MPRALFKKTIILMISLFYLISCLNDEKPKEKIINKNTAKIKITKSKKIYNIKVEEKGRTKDKSYYYSYSKKDKSLDDNKINSALNANLNVKDFDTSKKANNIKKNLSKNFIIKCSACHSNYANGIIGPSLLNKSAKDIFTLMMKYKNNEKSNALMDALIQNMSVKEIKDISYEISQLNKG